MIPPHLLALIPGCEAGVPPLGVQSLPGGRGCNVVLRVDTEAGRFVLRQRQAPLDRPGAVALTELRSQMAAASAGLAPRIIQAAVDGSWLLMDFIDAPPWTEAQLISEEGVEKLGLFLSRLHALPAPRGVPPLDAVRIAAGYIAQLQERDPRLAMDHQPLLARIGDLSGELAGLSLPAVLNHGDLQCGNMLGSRPVLVDWEYAQVVDPTYDIACLLSYYPALAACLPRLLACAGLGVRAARDAVELQLERFSCLNRLWNAVHVPKAG